MKSKYLLGVVVLAFIVLGLISSLRYTGLSVAEDSIKIGAVLILSGQIAEIGTAMQKGILIAQDEINSNGGFNGKPLKVIFEDDALLIKGPIGAVTSSQKLISSDKIVASLVTAVNDAKPIAPLFEESKIPLVTLWDSNKELESLGDYIFGIGFSTEKSGENMAEFAFNDLNINEIATAFIQDEWSQLIHKSFVEKFTEFGGKVNELGSYSTDETDFKTLITKLEYGNSKAIYFPFVTNPASVNFLKQAKEFGWDGIVLTGDLVTPELIDLAQDTIEGVYYTQVFAEENDRLTGLKEAYLKKFGKEPQLIVFTAWGYDGLNIIFEAIKIADSIEPIKINEAVYKIRGLEGATGIITFNEKGSAPKEERIWKVENRKEVLIK